MLKAQLDRQQVPPAWQDIFRCQVMTSVLDSDTTKEYVLSVITTVTGKNQVTIPAEIVSKADLKPGTRLEWRTTDRKNVLEVHVLPDRAAIAASLRGRGRVNGTRGKDALARLEQEREQDDRYWPAR